MQASSLTKRCNSVKFTSAMIPLGVIILVLRIPGCRSLKEKRGLLKPLLSDLRKKFNISAAEVDSQDAWQETVIACAMAGSDRVMIEKSLQKIPVYCENTHRSFQLVSQELEIF